MSLFGSLKANKINVYNKYNMSLLKYYNLLIFQPSQDTLEVIGEDGSITDFSTNPVESGMTVTELNAYQASLAAVTTLVVKYTDLSVLPPGSGLVNLLHLNIKNCGNITQIPQSYPSSLLSLRASNTKLSSIPSTLDRLTFLDISNCKRISSVGIASLETLIMSHCSVTELTQLVNLKRLVGLSTRIASIPVADNLSVVMWSGISGGTLDIDAANTSIVHVLTTGPESLVTAPSGVVVTSILL